jgi:enoyl-CoA hydratase/carnithine racemase
MELETILVEQADGVATVTLNRPDQRNTWTARMDRDLNTAFRALDEDDDVRVIVLTGAGSAFCAGADLSEGARFDQAGAPPREPLLLPCEIRKPVVAAINGHAVGVGITLALLCDVRFVAADAKVAFAFVRRGILPELASHAVLPRVVGFSRAADLLLSGRTITGTEAVELGLASEALPAEAVLPRALEWARDVAVNAAPVSAALAKRLLWEGQTVSVPEMASRENRLFAWVARQPDVKEGVAAFLERRPPQWTMRPSTDLPPAT